MVTLSGVKAINQALELISQELKFIKTKANRAKTSMDQRDKITNTDLKSFVQTLGGRLALLDQKTNDLLKLFHSAKGKPAAKELIENADYNTTDLWGEEILKLLKGLRDEQIFQVSPESVAKWVSDDDRETSIDDGRNVANVFAKTLESIEQHIRQERYKIKVEKTDTQNAA